MLNSLFPFDAPARAGPPPGCNCLTRAPVDDLALALFRTCVFVRFRSLTAASANKLTLDGLPTPPRDCSRGIVEGHVQYTLYLVFKEPAARGRIRRHSLAPLRPPFPTASGEPSKVTTASRLRQALFALRR
jgi:hypothetical protein